MRQEGGLPQKSFRLWHLNRHGLFQSYFTHLYAFYNSRSQQERQLVIYGRGKKALVLLLLITDLYSCQFHPRAAISVER